MSDLPCKAEDLIGKVDFVFSDPPYKITRARCDMEFDYRTMWEVIQRMLAQSGVVAVTCSLTAAVEILGAAIGEGMQ